MDQSLEPAKPEKPLKRRSIKRQPTLSPLIPSNGSQLPSNGPELLSESITQPSGLAIVDNSYHTLMRQHNLAMGNGIDNEGDNEITETWLESLERKFAYDPYGFYLEVWPDMPLRAWQARVLQDIQEQLANDNSICRIAVAAGKAAGKTRLLAILFIWRVVCHRKSKTLLTSNTKTQIDTRPWDEIKSLVRESRLNDYFKVQASVLLHSAYTEWKGITQTWSGNNIEAMAGLHGDFLGIFIDEASGVDDTVIRTLESGLKDPHNFIALFSNPTRLTGFFRKCFPGGSWVKQWLHYNIDTRTIPEVNQERIKEDLEKALDNEDDMHFRMYVRGLFPLTDRHQFISEALVELAKQRKDTLHDTGAPCIIGVDPARFGNNASAIVVRQGAKILYKKSHRGLDGWQLSGEIAQVYKEFEQYQPYVLIETAGVGASCADSYKARGFKYIPVEPAGNADCDGEAVKRYANKRMEMYANLKEALRTFLFLEDEEIIGQLLEMTYDYDIQNRYILESKDSMESRGVASPDEADALALTFADLKLARREKRNIHFNPRNHIQVSVSSHGRKGSWRNFFPG